MKIGEIWEKKICLEDDEDKEVIIVNIIKSGEKFDNVNQIYKLLNMKTDYFIQFESTQGHLEGILSRSLFVNTYKPKR